MAILLVLGAVVLLALVLAQIKRSRATQLLTRGSVIADTAKGPVEYAVVGSGPVVLMLHGGAGGWDQSVGLAVSLLRGCDELIGYERSLREGDALLQGRFTVINPSRVGYLRTPLSTGRTPAEGADAMAALLDALGVSRALVVGVSGGGPTALQFALRHPARCAALVMVAAISKRHVQPGRTTDNIMGRIVFARGAGWFVDAMLAAALTMFRLRSLWAAKKLLEATETLDENGIRERLAVVRRNPEYLGWMHGLMRSLYPLSARRVGLDNDLAQFAAIEDYSVGQIACPTMVVHGRHDGNVPFEHAEFVANGVPGAELVVAESCGHLLWTCDEEPRIRRAVVDFLAARAASANASLRRL